MEIESSDLIDKEPALEDFYSDMNRHPQAEYSMRNEYVIELERDIKDREMGRITIWKAQKLRNGFVPSPKDGVIYDWYGVARRFIEFDRNAPHTLSEMEYHFEETIREHPYEGPRTKTDITVKD